MALIKPRNIKGYTYEYWMISNVSGSKLDRTTDVVLSLYKNQGQRDIELDSYIMQTHVRINDYVLVVSDLYEMVKTAQTELDTYDGPTRIPYFKNSNDA